MKVKIGRLFSVSVLLVFSFALLFSLVSTLGCGQKVGEGSYADAIKKSRDFVIGLQERYDIPGMAVAVAIDNEIVWAEGFGYVNIEKEIPATPQTLFRVGSISKVLTAGAVALL
ncbi:MAG: beta-lactamase family protein, partial [Nitrospinae bacterium]|nr:beta-lactamase family protein [Nitrospinota bacterium]